MIGPSDIGLGQEKALAAKALAGLRNTSFAYGTQSTGFTRPSLAGAGPNQTPLDRLKRMLTGKADMGDAEAQLALGRLYHSAG